MKDGIEEEFAHLRTYTVDSTNPFRDSGYEGLEASLWWSTIARTSAHRKYGQKRRTMSPPHVHRAFRRHRQSYSE
jgi:hypothetical protein